MVPAINVVYIPNDTTLEKTDFSFAKVSQLEIVFVNDGSLCPLPPLDSGTSCVLACAGPVPAAVISNSIHVLPCCV